MQLSTFPSYFDPAISVLYTLPYFPKMVEPNIYYLIYFSRVVLFYDTRSNNERFLHKLGFPLCVMNISHDL